MSRFLRLSILVTGLLFISACILTECGSPTAVPNPIIEGLILRVDPQPSTYSTVGQVINYNFVVTNSTTSTLVGPPSISDSKMPAVACPGLNTVGNLDANLDANESVTCTGSYTITQGDITAGSMMNRSTATVGGRISNTVDTTIQMPPNPVLSLAVAANPTSYSQVGQNITYTYTITNTGAATLAPAQCIVRDDRIPTPINCGPNTTTLATNQTVTCSAIYTIAQPDIGVNQITNTANASCGGAGTIQSASVTITNTAPPNGSVTPNPNYTRGETVRHPVEKGDWLLQISRCYGADYEAVRAANPQIIDPHWIYPLVDTVIVPNIGSNGTIYGRPCVKWYIVVSGDTWQSIANAHNADIEVLMEANQNVTLSAGNEIKVPLNSRGSGTIPPTTTPARQPIRLNFPAGSPTVTLTGTIGTPDTIRHVFTGTQGQILTVKLTVPTNDVGLAIYAPSGAALKPLDNTLSWSGTLTATGDHFIDLVSTLGSTSKAYSLEVTLSTPAPASPVERVADINAGVGDSNPSHLSVFNGQLYFQANANDGAGAELWRYDSGLKAISRVADMNAGAGGSEPAFLTPYSDNLYFRANGNDAAGAELWRFNGTTAGRVTDLNSGAADANPMYLTVFNGALYFSANGNDGKGVELWKYDGTVTSRVADINPDAGDSNPAYLAVFNNALYFSATSNDGAGTELWKFDGTTATRVADLNTGVGNSNPAFLTVFNNVLYFSANVNDSTGTELWKFDGTNASRAADVNAGAADSVPTYLTVFNNALYFSANGDSAGFELWKYDGTNVSRVTDINTTGGSNPAYLTVYNNELYFQANGGDGAGAELWKFKGP